MASGDITASRGKLSDFPCAVFDGVDDVVTITSNTITQSIQGDTGITYSCWVNLKNFDAADSAGLMVMQTPNKILRINKDTKKVQAIFTSILESLTAINFNSWTHIAVTNDNVTTKIYINGVLNNSGLSALGSSSSGNLLLGQQDNSRCFGGGLKECKLYNRVLSSTEIANLYNGTNLFNGLVGYWPLKEDYNDYSGFANHGINSGSYLTNTLPNKLKADTNTLNLAAVTDKLIVVPRPGRIGQFAVIGSNRAA
jgi:hypothetical protein